MSYFIADEGVFSSIRADLGSVVDVDIRLPMRPFRQPVDVVVFEEFDWALSGNFRLVLQNQALRSGDQELVFAVLDRIR